jgi:hypothetical protein
MAIVLVKSASPASGFGPSRSGVHDETDIIKEEKIQAIRNNGALIFNMF